MPMTRWKCRLCINTAIFHSTAYSCVTRSTGFGMWVDEVEWFPHRCPDASTHSLLLWHPACAGLGNESARWRGGVFFGEVRRTRFTRHEDRSGERNEELACARSEEWAVAHGEERPSGRNGEGKKEAVRLREQCTCGAREQMAYAIGNFAPGGCSPSSQYRRTRYCYAAAPALRNSVLRELRARCARVEYSPRLAPQQDESPEYCGAA